MALCVCSEKERRKCTFTIEAKRQYDSEYCFNISVTCDVYSLNRLPFEDSHVLRNFVMRYFDADTCDAKRVRHDFVDISLSLMQACHDSKWTLLQRGI